MRQWTVSSWVQIIACRLFEAIAPTNDALLLGWPLETAVSEIFSFCIQNNILKIIVCMMAAILSQRQKG